MTISWMDLNKKDFSNSLAGSVMESNYLLFILFTANMLFQLNEILMLLLSCLSIILFSLYVDVSVKNL